MRRLALWLLIVCATSGLLLVRPGATQEMPEQGVTSTSKAARGVSAPRLADVRPVARAAMLPRTKAPSRRWIAVVQAQEVAELHASGTLHEALLQGLGRYDDAAPEGILTGSIRPNLTSLPTVTTSRLGTGVRGVGFFLFCIDQVRGFLPDSDIVLFSEVVPGSGAHDHDDAGDPSRPLGTLDPTSGNTGADGMQFRSELTAAEAAELQVITAFCTPPDGGQLRLTFTIGVRVTGLQRLPDLDGFALVGATAAHPIANNHFGTTRLNSAIAVLALKYKTAFANGPELGINDQSLEEGGLFDIGPPLGKFWEPPH